MLKCKVEMIVKKIILLRRISFVSGKIEFVYGTYLLFLEIKKSNKPHALCKLVWPFSIRVNN